jgi:hypothetical protein
MEEDEISSVIDTVYGQWPARVDTIGKRALGTESFQIDGLWEYYERVNDKLREILISQREILMAQAINWAIFKAISEIGKSEDAVRLSTISRASLVPLLESCAHEPSLQPEIMDVVRYLRGAC